MAAGMLQYVRVRSGSDHPFLFVRHALASETCVLMAKGGHLSRRASTPRTVVGGGPPSSKSWWRVGASGADDEQTKISRKSDLVCLTSDEWCASTANSNDACRTRTVVVVRTPRKSPQAGKKKQNQSRDVYVRYIHTYVQASRLVFAAGTARIPRNENQKYPCVINKSDNIPTTCCGTPRPHRRRRRRHRRRHRRPCGPDLFLLGRNQHENVSAQGGAESIESAAEDALGGKEPDRRRGSGGGNDGVMTVEEF